MMFQWKLKCYAVKIRKNWKLTEQMKLVNIFKGGVLWWLNPKTHQKHLVIILFFRNLNLDINDEDFIIFLGASGCEKTFLNLIGWIDNITDVRTLVAEDELVEIADGKHSESILLVLTSFWQHTIASWCNKRNYTICVLKKWLVLSLHALYTCQNSCVCFIQTT